MHVLMYKFNTFMSVISLLYNCLDCSGSMSDSLEKLVQLLRYNYSSSTSSAHAPLFNIKDSIDCLSRTVHSTSVDPSSAFLPYKAHSASF